jgi:hypothetical protein
MEVQDDHFYNLGFLIYTENVNKISRGAYNVPGTLVSRKLSNGLMI